MVGDGAGAARDGAVSAEAEPMRERGEGLEPQGGRQAAGRDGQGEGDEGLGLPPPSRAAGALAIVPEWIRSTV